MSRRLHIVLWFACGLALVFLWGTRFPLGVSGEWTWQRITYADGDILDAVLGTVVAVVLVVGFLAFVRSGVNRIDRAGRLKTAGWLCGLWAFTVVLLWVIQQAVPGGYSAAKQMWVLYDHGSSGYFYEAVSSRDDTPTFLNNYAGKMAEGDVLHIGTHPPGLILLHRGFIGLCRSSPAVTRAVLAAQPRAYDDAFTTLKRQSSLAGEPLQQSDRAALWLAVVFTHVVAAATVVPLFLLVRRDYGARAGWMTAAFWPFVPALGVFLPKSDALFPCLGLLFLWCWHGAMRRRSVFFAAAAGMMMWLGLMLSLALLPVALFAVLWTLRETFREAESAPDTRSLRGIDWNRICTKFPWGRVLTALLAFAAATVALYGVFDANLLDIWWHNYRNHAAFYRHEAHPRTWWKWLLVNAVELTLSVGVPVTILAGYAVRQRFQASANRRKHQNGPLWCAVIVIGLLWLSGKNMGEAGRLWLFLMPWGLWMTAGLWDSEAPAPPADNNGRKRRMRSWLMVLSLQAALCLATVLRVKAFFLFR